MNLKNKYMVFCAIVLMLAPIVLSTMTGNITSSDWTYRHTLWISRYLHGDFSPAREYPPMFHLMMAPFVAMDFPVIWFQVVFVVLTTSTILYFAWKKEGDKALLLTAFMLASSIAYVSFAGSLMPQALDYLFFAGMLLCYYSKRYAAAGALSLAFFSMHLSAAIFIMIMFIHSLVTKRYRFALVFLIAGLAVAPLFLHYIDPNAISNPMMQDVKWDAAAQAEWEAQYLRFPEFFIFSGFIMWGLLPFALKRAWAVRFKLSDTQLLYVIWMLCLFPTALYGLGWWRMTTYMIVPLCLFTASLVSEDEIFKF